MKKLFIIIALAIAYSCNGPADPDDKDRISTETTPPPAVDTLQKQDTLKQ